MAYSRTRAQNNGPSAQNVLNTAQSVLLEREMNFPYTCMQSPRLRTVCGRLKWPVPAPVRKIMALGRKVLY